MGAVLKRKAQSVRTARPLKFLRTAFFLKIRTRNDNKEQEKTHNPPSFLDTIAKAVWKDRIPQLLERGDIEEADLIHLELYCVNYSLFRAAVEDIHKNGFSIVNSQGTQSRNPALSAKADAEKVMVKMSSLLGFDPVSRRKNPIEVEAADMFDQVLTM